MNLKNAKSSLEKFEVEKSGQDEVELSVERPEWVEELRMDVESELGFVWLKLN